MTTQSKDYYLDLVDLSLEDIRNLTAPKVISLMNELALGEEWGIFVTFLHNVEKFNPAVYEEIKTHK